MFVPPGNPQQGGVTATDTSAGTQRCDIQPADKWCGCGLASTGHVQMAAGASGHGTASPPPGVSAHVLLPKARLCQLLLGTGPGA